MLFPYMKRLSNKKQITTMQKDQFSTIDDYIAFQPAPLRAALEQLRQTIKKAAPDAEEVISYQMPAFRFHGMLVYFAALKNHFGFYPMPQALVAFKDKLTSYELGKGTIKFPLDKPLPVKLVTEIVKFRVKENLDKKLLKEVVKKTKTKK